MILENPGTILAMVWFLNYQRKDGIATAKRNSLPGKVLVSGKDGIIGNAGPRYLPADLTPFDLRRTDGYFSLDYFII
jgi:hypothetical protein